MVAYAECEGTDILVYYVLLYTDVSWRMLACVLTYVECACAALLLTKPLYAAAN